MCPIPWGTAAPHFSADVNCLRLCRFLDRPLRIETRVDENQLLRVETNNFVLVVRLCCIPITRFSVNLASNHCVITLQESTEHFLSTGTTRAIGTSTVNSHHYHTRFLCSICYAYDSIFSTFSSIFSYLALGSSPLYPILIQ